MPIYIHCPHCEHPHVVPSSRQGQAVRCRQCANAFKASSDPVESQRYIPQELSKFQSAPKISDAEELVRS